MKKIIALCLVLFLLPFPVDNQDGAYNIISRLAWCRTRAACLHEIGHALDQRANWVSQSPEFYQTLQMYLFVEIYQQGVTELPAAILEITYRGNGGSTPIKRELYAYLFEQSDGCSNKMPESLRGFFDWETARTYLSMLNKHQTIYWIK